MKEIIGEKIKRIRTEFGFSQDSIGNQGQISQIESGEISNPNKSTLKAIARRLDIPFEDLIDETNWENKSSVAMSEEIAFSPAVVDVEVDDDGNINWSHKIYPLQNEKGERNEYCLESGRKLITNCGECGRQVENAKQKYCIGCGVALFPKFHIPGIVYEYIEDRYVFDDYTPCNEVIGILGDLLSTYIEILDSVETFSGIEILDKEQQNKILRQYKRGWASLPKPIDDALRQFIQNGKEIGKEIPEYIFDQIKFCIQVTEAVQKKLKSHIITLKPAPVNTIDEIKTELFRRTTAQIVPQMSGMPVEELVGVIKTLGINQDTDDLINDLQSKFDLDVDLEDDGNSETAVVKYAEQANKDAKEKDNKKESKDD